MAANLDRFKTDLAALIKTGALLESAMLLEAYDDNVLRRAIGKISDENFKKLKSSLPIFRTAYEKWYSQSLALLKQILPDRVDAFVRHYEKPKTRKEISWDNYVIEDFMIGLQVTRAGEILVDRKAAFPKLQNQTAILAAAEARFESSLFEIRQIVQADLFDSEIDAARELLTKKFLRAAGAIAGVVLEKHLRQVCDDHRIPVLKKHPAIGDLNELLKNNGVTEVSQWRHISMLADIRNLCDHNKNKEPTAEQVEDLISGTDKILKTIS